MPLYGQTMIMSRGGLLRIQHWKGSASWQNGLQIVSPVSLVLATSANDYPGNEYIAGPYPAGTEIRVRLINIPNPYTEESTSMSAQFQDGYTPGESWFINWEDNQAFGADNPSFPADNDYNDSFTLIQVTHAGPINLSGIKYRAWEDDAVDD